MLRFYGKKRGERRTGSQRLGSYGEALFYSVLLWMGAVGFYYMLTQMILPEWQANRRFVPAECVVEGASLASERKEDKEVYRPEIHIRCEIDGQTLSVKTYDVNHLYSYTRAEAQKIADQFEIGQVYRCWYDPQDHARIVLVRGYSWWLWLLLILPASFVVVGLVGAVRALLHSGTSVERRAAMAQKASQLDLFDDGVQRGAAYPSIPGAAQINDSPGTRLAYRLPVNASPGWELAGVVVLCILWNGIVAWFAIVNLSGWMRGQGEWLMSLLLLPFFGVGCGLIGYAVKRILFIAAIGSTRVELSDHPLTPGKTYDLFIAHCGNMRPKSLEVKLVCLEKATYRQGTDSRSESAAVFEQSLYHNDALELEIGVDFEETCQVHVPASAMHSFQSRHNEIKWQLVVQSSLEKWPDFRREFPVIVHPADARRDDE